MSSLIKDKPTRRSKKSNIILFGSLIFILILISFVNILTGTVSISISELFRILLNNDPHHPEWIRIIYDFRLPRLITAVLAGSALSVSGLQMQTLFRNPLAGPYVLGISAGASLGVAILVMGFSGIFVFNGMNITGNWILVVFAWIGSGMVLLIIFFVSLRVKDIMTILILGILLGSAITAIVAIMQFFSNEAMLKTFIVWTMGSLSGVTKSQLSVMVPGLVVGLVIALATGKILNVMQLGELYAESLGLRLKPARLIIFFSTSLLAGTITAFCGPIGFIGIAVPHIARLLFKTANQHVLLWGSLIIGSIVLVGADIISNLNTSYGNIPINSVTALIGIPVVIYLIVKNQRLSSML